MNKLCVVAALISAVAPLGAEDEKPTDVKGCQNVTWGMTTDQAATALGTTASRTPEHSSTGYIEKLAVPHLDIAGLKMLASIEALNGEDAITLVILNLRSDSLGSEIERHHAFDTLKPLLIEKYGAPKSEEQLVRGNDVVHAAHWTFPSTLIKLTWTEGRRWGTGTVSLEYRAVDQKAIKAL